MAGTLEFAAEKKGFTSYQKFAILILALTQFTVVLDFMVMSPLGDMLMRVDRLIKANKHRAKL